MARREFQLIEGTAKKFWAVEVDGTTQKVHYGRIGTTGQANVKEFATEAEAKTATDKLVAEKVKKGYSEVASGSAAPAAPAPTVKAKKEKQAEPEAPPAAEPAPPIKAAIERKIDLDPEDWERAAWPRVWKQKTRSQLAPFDRQRSLDILASVKPTQYGYWPHNWTMAIPENLSGEEAHFWLQVHSKLGMMQVVRVEPAEFAKTVADIPVKPSLSFDEAVELLSRMDMGQVVRPLAFLVPPREFVQLALRDWKDKYGRNLHGIALAATFSVDVLPFLSDAEKREIEDTIRPLVQPGSWSTEVPVACRLAASLGMIEEVNAGLAAVPFAEGFGRFPDAKLLVFALGNPEWVEAAGRRMKLLFSTPAEIRHWLAVTKYSGLDVVRDSILNADSAYDYSSGTFERHTSKDQAARLTEEFSLVKAPEAAPFMLELKLGSKAPHVPRQWLDENVGCAVAGLIPVAAGRGKLAEAAVEYLREAKKKGHENLIRECLAGAAPEVAESIRRNVLDFAEKEYAVHDDKSLPADLKAALEVKAKKGKVPTWAAPSTLPPIVVGDKKLSDAHVAAVVEALSRSTLEAPDPLIPILKQHADETSLDNLAWKLFQLWQGESTPPKEKWAMGAVGLIGGDASALKLTPLVRAWPGESQHQRAVFGLECLRTIGSDTALMQLNGIAQKLKFKGLKEKAAQAMEAIATAKGLTRSQLEDRIVPDCDLDERGSRVFDFGPRQFRFVLGPEMKPMIKDADGKVKTDLPKPGAKDDSTKADAAVAEWKLLKKQIKEVATIQAQRLEQAMVTGRRWPVADFQTLLVKHPLMTNLVRLLLWGGYDSAGKLASTFRVTEDQTLADMKDDEYAPTKIDTVGIVHPLHLTAEQQSTWGEVFSDYELIPPFRQLGRRVVRPEPEELKASAITRFQGIAVPAPTLVYGLEKLGWSRGTGMDGGGFDEHSKPFPAAQVTAVVHYEGNVGFGYIDPNETLKITTCYFVKGIRPPSGYMEKEKHVPLKDIDPVAISEVLTDLSALASKG
jgi:predicted DNA-binding WGR domain protein